MPESHLAGSVLGMAETTVPPRRRPVRRYLLMGALALLGLLVVIQFVPYGRDHANPPPSKQVALSTAAQRELFKTSCQDCHSDQTDWLWYSNVAPVSWLIQNDVEGGREHLNLSAWDRPQAGLDDVVEAIQGGGMPPIQYKLSPYHLSAGLSAAEKRQLVAGFKVLYGADPPPPGGGG